ncbi:ABC transporter permease [Nibrella saemangeumensis]|uniref:ABC transporter permease n=1 Tax=Nibrella saemangeumensis TaxID=1084526 RepID=A0ABP8N8R2_9BACT
MLRNYLTIAVRNLFKNKVFSAINIVGLALGLACSLLIFLWIQDERSIDRFHANGDRLFRVMEQQQYSGQIEVTNSTPGLLAESLKKEVPEVDKAAEITWEVPMLLTAGSVSGRATGRFATPEFFEVFSFPLLYGDATSVLSEPGKLVISESLARKYFGNENPVGRVLRIDNVVDVLVSGVFTDIPEKSSLTFDFLVPYQHFLQKNEWAKEWGNNAPLTFVRLQPEASAEKVDAKIANFVKAKDKNSNVTLFLQNYGDSYLYSNFTNGQQDGGRIDYVRLFTVVAIVILLIACVNFMNLATARSAKRAKEVGIRKVVGAGRYTLAGQFLGEAFLITLLAFVLTLIVVWLFLPTFNNFTQKHISIQFTDPQFVLTLLSLAVLTGLVAGSYPALFLSSLMPLRVLKGGASSGILKFKQGATLFRQGLVVFQFTVSVILIVGTVIVFQQMKYIRTKNLGFTKENLIVLPLEAEMHKNVEAYRQDVLASPAIRALTLTSQPPMEVSISTGGVEWPGKQADERVEFPFILTDHDFVAAMSISLKEGRNFNRSMPTDSSVVLINEEAARRMRLQNPVGQTIRFWNRPHQIVGVLKDFHINSLHVAMQPLILHLAPGVGSNNYILVRTQPGQTQQALAVLQAANRKYNPAYPFEYHFLDETFERQYRSELIVESLTNYFALLAIVISCLGLLGLTIFTTEQRTKEVGVRKVLGASVSNLVYLLSKDFLKLVFIANGIAFPIAWWMMNNWLNDFAFKADLKAWVFVVAGGAALLIAFLTISFQAVRTALMNPVNSLQSE